MDRLIRVVDKGGVYEIYENDVYQMNIKGYWLDTEEDVVERYLKEIKRLDEEDDEEF